LSEDGCVVLYFCGDLKTAGGQGEVEMGWGVGGGGGGGGVHKKKRSYS